MCRIETITYVHEDGHRENEFYNEELCKNSNLGKVCRNPVYVDLGERYFKADSPGRGPPVSPTSTKTTFSSNHSSQGKSNTVMEVAPLKIRRKSMKSSETERLFASKNVMKLEIRNQRDKDGNKKINSIERSRVRHKIPETDGKDKTPPQASEPSTATNGSIETEKYYLRYASPRRLNKDVVHHVEDAASPVRGSAPDETSFHSAATESYCGLSSVVERMDDLDPHSLIHDNFASSPLGSSITQVRDDSNEEALLKGQLPQRPVEIRAGIASGNNTNLSSLRPIFSSASEREDNDFFARQKARAQPRMYSFAHNSKLSPSANTSGPESSFQDNTDLPDLYSGSTISSISSTSIEANKDYLAKLGALDAERQKYQEADAAGSESQRVGELEEALQERDATIRLRQFQLEQAERELKAYQEREEERQRRRRERYAREHKAKDVSKRIDALKGEIRDLRRKERQANEMRESKEQTLPHFGRADDDRFDMYRTQHRRRKS